MNDTNIHFTAEGSEGVLGYKFSPEHNGGVWWVPQSFWRRVWLLPVSSKTKTEDGNLGTTVQKSATLSWGNH